MADKPKLPGLWAWIGTGMATIVFLGAVVGLEESRQFLGRLTEGDYVTGTVDPDARTIQSTFFKTASVMHRSLEEEGYDDDDSVSWRTKEDKLRLLPFDLITSEGRVRVRGKPKGLEYPDSRVPAFKGAKYARFSEWHVAPGDEVTVLGRARAGERAGRIYLFRGTPRQWKAMARDDARGSLILLLVIWVILAAVGGNWTWRMAGVVLGTPATPARRGKPIWRAPHALAAALARVDLDWIERPVASQSWFVQLLRLAGASALGGVYLVGIGTAAALVLPAFWGLAPFDGEGALRLQFANYATAAAVLLGILSVGREALEVYYQRRAAEEIGRVSDVLLQVVGHLIAAGVDDEVAVGWEDTAAELTARTPAGKAVVAVRARGLDHLEWRAGAPIEGREPTVWTRVDGAWRSGTEVTDDVAAAVGRQVRDHLRARKHLAETLREREGVTLRRGDLAGGDFAASSWRLLPVGNADLPEISGEGGLWRTRHRDALLYLAGVGCLLLGPTTYALSLSLGWLDAPNAWMGLASLALIPGVALFFRPPMLGVPRRRQVRTGATLLRLDANTLRYGAVAIDLDRPYRIHLTEQREGASRYLGVEIRPQGAGRQQRLQLLVALSPEAPELPALQLQAPVMSGREFHSFWPGLRARAQAHGADSPWIVVR